MNAAHHPEPPAGVDSADAPLWAALYDELRVLARHKLRAESAPDLLQTTALVHEAWLRLDGRAAGIHDRQHFMRLAARVMRHVLIDQARALRGRQRDPGRLRVTLDSHIPGGDPVEPTDLLDIDAALNRLADDNRRWADVLELHYFGGMTYAEIAETLDVSEVTVKRDLRSGRAWLMSDIDADAAP